MARAPAPLRWLLGAAVLALAGCATLPTEYREPPPLAAADRAQFNLRVFDRAWSLVNQHYFDAGFRGVNWSALRDRYRPEAAKAADTTALYAVLNRMGAELKESHLAALPPRRVHEIETERRVAVGIRWQLKDGQRVITDIVPGGPAELAGVRRGWLILSRNGQPIRDGQVFVARLGEPIRFEFRDEQDQVRTIALQPQLVGFEREEVRRLADGVIYLRFDEFKRQPLRWLSEQLKRNADAPAVIVDLRQNGGGNTLAMNVAVAEFFSHAVNEGTLVYRNGRSTDARSFAWRSADFRGRVVLLTGPYTASAAEIFAHVLQHHHRALLVGRRTAGAVIYARSYRLPGGGSLQVPVIDYVALDGQRLEGHGVTPDIVVPEASFADLRAGRDPELAAALAAMPRAPYAAAAERR
jgi:carboxyl-terminal processing protease